MLGGFKWHSNAGGLEGGLLTQVSQGSHCAAGGTHRSHHTPSPLPPALMPYSSCLNSEAVPRSSALNSTWTLTSFFFSDIPLYTSNATDEVSVASRSSSVLTSKGENA